MSNPSESTTTLPKASRRERTIPFIIFAIVLLLDQASKYLVETSLAFYEIWAPIPALEPFFRIMHVTNTGMAFGLFPGGGLFFGVMAFLVSGAILYYNHTLPAGNIWMRIALGLTLGGAIGNMLDRLRLGHVTDFLDFGPWPLFNVADMAVVSGAIILAWQMVREIRAERQQAALNKNSSDSAPNN